MLERLLDGLVLGQARLCWLTEGGRDESQREER
jgi:hypothetical protein